HGEQHRQRVLEPGLRKQAPRECGGEHLNEWQPYLGQHADHERKHQPGDKKRSGGDNSGQNVALEIVKRPVNNWIQRTSPYRISSYSDAGTTKPGCFELLWQLSRTRITLLIPDG